MTFADYVLYALLGLMAVLMAANVVLYGASFIEALRRRWRRRQERKRYEARMKALAALGVQTGDEVAYNGKVYTVVSVDYVYGCLVAYGGGENLNAFMNRLPDLKKVVKCPMEYKSDE